MAVMLATVDIKSLKLEDELRGKKQRVIWNFQNMQHILNFDRVFQEENNQYTARLKKIPKITG